MFRTEISGGRFSPVGRWKGSFSPAQVETFEGLVGPFLKELEYPLSTPVATRSVRLTAIRALYQSSFSLKLWLKSGTPLGRFLMRMPV